MTDDGLLMLQGWARDGLTDEQISDKMGIGTTTLYRWLNDFGEIRAALKKGRSPVDVEVENALLKRALGFTYDEVIEEEETLPSGKSRSYKRTVTKTVPPDVTAQIFWLKNRKPAQWRDKPEPPVSSEALEKLDEVLSNIKGVV